MAPRSSWKGFLKLSLVSVPVRAFTAHDSAEEIHLNQLHQDCHNRVRYKKVCPEHGELKADEIVSGYEYAKDSYVVIDPAEVQKLRKQSDRSINIHGFVDPESIDPMYLAGRSYYLLPDGVAGNRPYALLHQGMVEENVHAVAQVILAGREQLVVVRPVDKLLVMSVLSYKKKIKGAETFRDEVSEQETTKEELSLAHTLIQASRIQDFDLARYEDEYVENLGELIRLKIEGEEIVQAPEPEEPKIINLMEALKKSVAEAQASTKMAPSERTSARSKSKAKSSGAKKGGRSKKTG